MIGLPEDAVCLVEEREIGARVVKTSCDESKGDFPFTAENISHPSNISVGPSGCKAWPIDSSIGGTNRDFLVSCLRKAKLHGKFPSFIERIAVANVNGREKFRFQKSFLCLLDKGRVVEVPLFPSEFGFDEARACVV